jgi:hypothetical protein
MSKNGNKGPCPSSDNGQHNWAKVTNSKGEVTGEVCSYCGATR